MRRALTIGGLILLAVVMVLLLRSRQAPVGDLDDAARTAPGGASSLTGTAGPVASVSGAAPSPAKKPLTSAEFQQLSEHTLQALPKIADIQKLKGEAVHEAPAAIRRAGAELGDLAQAVADNPSLAPQAFEFYASCGKEADLPPQVRALCYLHYAEWGAKLGRQTDPELVPPAVKELANKLK